MMFPKTTSIGNFWNLLRSSPCLTPVWDPFPTLWFTILVQINVDAVLIYLILSNLRLISSSTRYYESIHILFIPLLMVETFRFKHTDSLMGGHPFWTMLDCWIIWNPWEHLIASKKLWKKHANYSFIYNIYIYIIMYIYIYIFDIISSPMSIPNLPLFPTVAVSCGLYSVAMPSITSITRRGPVMFHS